MHSTDLHSVAVGLDSQMQWPHVATFLLCLLAGPARHACFVGAQTICMGQVSGVESAVKAANALGLVNHAAHKSQITQSTQRLCLLWYGPYHEVHTLPR
jgi:hypothetical protein